MTVDTVLLVHVGATWALIGLIWFVQMVHYPLFATVGTGDFDLYEAQHTRRTALVVGVLMPAEAITAAWLLIESPDGVATGFIALGLVLVAAVWLSTALVQAPIHGRLSTNATTALQRRLVQTNWLRTVAWSVRGVLVLVMAGQALA